ncbi:helix-turn-helix domain-containing protein [Endozoicomonas gorgoniicola]|uniref:Helix-turn-helix domain-containing protein n=1 Tax=Endozoicomonas gorgoniicola TaxID=1234144 RepID=A0ABT3MU30_9GAMM|nr:helix-turn-helix domain-containing protein [Endozoicomonas gorgoniicola]MCW7552890.1 helix-turn-helix domain-containing protein [Endozoicomonas gorgoniicola]
MSFDDNRLQPNSLLTICDAADLLNVSISYMKTLFESGAIQCVSENDEVRVQYQALIDYKLTIDAKRLAALDELSALFQLRDKVDAGDDSGQVVELDADRFLTKQRSAKSSDV